MACMEYECLACGFVAANNRPAMNGGFCPECGCVLRQSFDEENDDHGEEEPS